MSGVDVIAVIRQHAESHRQLAICDAYSAQEAPKLEAALAAVSALIAADREFDKALQAFNKVRANPPVKVEIRYARAIARRAGALLACGGAK